MHGDHCSVLLPCKVIFCQNTHRNMSAVSLSLSHSYYKYNQLKSFSNHLLTRHACTASSSLDHSIEMNIPGDSVYGRKLRALLPRPANYPTAEGYPFPAISSHFCCGIQNHTFLQWNHQMSCAPTNNNGVKSDVGTVPGALVSSTRWNPTPEQLEALEDMYRRGIRTPSAEQIQQIAARLKKLGKIEGKNVFYWFQNHKARERQKKRRQMDLIAAGKKTHRRNTTRTTQTGLIQEYDKDKFPIAVPYSNLCITASQASAVITDCKREGLAQKIYWQLESETAFCPDNAEPRGLKLQECQTLELFPMERMDQSVIRHEEEGIENFSSVAPQQFIEFLPTKK